MELLLFLLAFEMDSSGYFCNCYISFILSRVLGVLLDGLSKESGALGTQESSFYRTAVRETARSFCVDDGELYVSSF